MTTVKSKGSPYGTIDGRVANRHERRKFVRRHLDRISRKALREETAVAKTELRWRLRRLEAMRAKERA